MNWILHLRKDALDDHLGIDQGNAQYAQYYDQFDQIVQDDIVPLSFRLPQKHQKEQKEQTHHIKVIGHVANFWIFHQKINRIHREQNQETCLLYTSDAADD